MANIQRILLILLISPVGVFAQSGLESPPDYTLRRIKAPILMYHYVSELPPDADPYRVGLTVHPDLFRDHMRFLADEGYQSISLREIDAALVAGHEIPEKSVVLTFDDGHIDHYTTVFPVLKEFGFTGTFFLMTSRMDNRDPVYINWEQAREMAEAGMHIEGHTKNHPDLRERNLEFLVYEIMGSLESIQAHTDYMPNVFAYPGGRYDDTVLRFLESTAIQRAVTTQTGNLHTTSNRFEVTRLRVTNETSVAGLRYLLTTDL